MAISINIDSFDNLNANQENDKLIQHNSIFIWKLREQNLWSCNALLHFLNKHSLTLYVKMGKQENHLPFTIQTFNQQSLFNYHYAVFYLIARLFLVSSTHTNKPIKQRWQIQSKYKMIESGSGSNFWGSSNEINLRN